jgi:hypothetical protein
MDMLNLLLGKSPKGVRADNDLYRAYEALTAADVLIKVSIGTRQLYDFQINFSAVLLYVQLGCLENIIKGPVFTVMKYTNSTVAIIVEKEGREFAGTGNILTNGEETFVLTNRHVVDPDQGCQLKAVLLGGDPSAKLKISAKPLLCGSDDLATLPISAADVPKNVPAFRLSTGASILQDVIALVYRRFRERRSCT